jgi:hypothetical protein
VVVHIYALQLLQCSSNVQRADGVSLAVPYKVCLVYQDDVIVSQTFQEQLDNLRKMFQRFQGAHLKLNLEK